MPYPSVRHDVDYYDLTRGRRQLIDFLLWHLGFDEAGYTRESARSWLPTSLRAWLSHVVAVALGLALPRGHQLARCHVCDVIGDAADMREGFDRAWRCSTDRDCHARFERDYDVE